MKLTIKQEQKLVNDYYNLLITHKTAYFNFWLNKRCVEECSTLIDFLKYKDKVEFDSITVIPF